MRAREEDIMHHFRTVIPRISNDERTFAVIDCYLAVIALDDDLDQPNRFREALTEIVTDTMLADWETYKSAWDYAGSDFNIGDLASLMEDDPNFINRLSARGILVLRISVFVDADIPSGWTYDTCLVDAARIEEELEERGQQ